MWLGMRDSFAKRESRNKKTPQGVLAGDEGFEPPNAGTRTQCLTAWRIPNAPLIIPQKSDFVKNPTIYYSIYSLRSASTGSFFAAAPAGMIPPIKVKMTLSAIRISAATGDKVA